MGFKERSKNAPVTFANINAKTGQIVEKDRNGGPSKYHESLEGLIEDVTVRTNKDVVIPGVGKRDITNMSIKFAEPGQDTIIASIALGSWMSAKLAGVLNAADLTKPIRLDVGLLKAGDKIGDRVQESEASWIAGYQGGQRVMPKYANGTDKLPDAIMIKVGKEMKPDMTPVEAEIAATVGLVLDKVDAFKNPHQEGSGDDETGGVDAEEVTQAAQLAMRQRA